uniref:Putative LAGLIDADG homing endonuclease n=1 Tax=Jenufa minuta TaxID=993092 RepID=A0A0S2LP94_JENMI|nr:putative LAGLIDADG homing endonuclease [Jenufa minuta]ALO63018.1 putative LAGLIDADG homing endonuclease [Jenufa minuta]
MLNLKEIEIAWIAGLFEGEAYFGLDTRSKKRYKVSSAPVAPFIKISMVDQDVIGKVAKLLNKSYFVPSRKIVTKKTVYTLHIGDRATLSYLFPRIFPHLGRRRQETAQKCMDALKVWEV